MTSLKKDLLTNGMALTNRTPKDKIREFN